MKYLIALGLIVWLVHTLTHDPFWQGLLAEPPAAPVVANGPCIGYASPDDLSEAGVTVSMVA